MINTADPPLFGVGYFYQQGFSMLNLLFTDLDQKYFFFKNLRQIKEDENEERAERAAIPFAIGGLVGIGQDLVSSAFAVSYIAGNDSKLAKIAAGVMVGKVALNALSIAARCVYSKTIKGWWNKED